MQAADRLRFNAWAKLPERTKKRSVGVSLAFFVMTNTGDGERSR